MKKTIICNIPMKRDVEANVYESSDDSIPVSSNAFIYPVNSFLSQTLTEEDELKVLLLVKKDDNSYYSDNTEKYKNELHSISEAKGISPDFVIIDTKFEENKATHAQLMGRIIDEIENDSHIIADITFGPKDLPIVVFSSLFFAENYLNCAIDNIVYGQAFFNENKVVSANICDMIPLYYLSSLSTTINCSDPEKARQMIKRLLSI